MASDRLAGVALLLAALAIAAPASAQPSAADKETARSLMDKGDEKMDAKDYASAIKAYTAADAIMHLPMTGVAVAKAQVAAGLLVEARDTAMSVTRLPVQPGETAAYTRARAEAAEIANALPARIPSIQIVIERAPADLAVTVDGAAIPAAAALEPRKVNPGAHAITVSAAGFAPAGARVEAAEGAAIKVPIKLVPVAAPAPVLAPTAPPPAAPPKEAPPRSTSPLVFVGFGVGGAGLVAGAITGGLSLAKTSSIKGECSAGGSCPLGRAGDLSTANTLANVCNASLGIGAAGVVLGVVGLVISRPTKPAAARVEPVIGPGALGFRGVF